MQKGGCLHSRHMNSSRGKLSGSAGHVTDIGGGGTDISTFHICEKFAIVNIYMICGLISRSR